MRLKICGKQLHVKWAQASGDVVGGVPQCPCANMSKMGTLRNFRCDSEQIALRRARCSWLLEVHGGLQAGDHSEVRATKEVLTC
jgi:hypothetical protein